MEQLQQILTKLDSMEIKFGSMDDKITALDTAIRGDSERGVDGMKQHVVAIRKEFHNHTVSDTQQFSQITNNQYDITEKISKAKWWLAGAACAVTCFSGLISLALKYFKP